LANVQAMATTFKKDILNGLHAFGTSVIRAGTTPDTFYGALYLASGSLGAGTTAYGATSEVSGAGYSAGGAAFTTATPPSNSGTAAIFTPSASLVFTSVTLSTSFDTCLMYNFTAAGKNAVGVFTFGAQTVNAGNFTLTMPTNALGTALIQIS
jgi:hypothetical protein